tara:strand:+ start:842 stop:2734 length:1893 start_codon:yes stop_codon:yes gene_type:complete
MIGGLGTNVKSPFGWKCDPSTGEPEAYYWQGTVRYYEPYYDYDQSTETYTLNYDVSIDSTKSNKLYKLTFDHANRKVSRTLVWDGKDTFISDNSNYSKSFGNLEFISRDTFVITEEYSPADPSGQINDTYRKAIMWGNKIEDDGTVTPKVWSRVILEDWIDEGATDEENQFDYPGTILGVSSIPPTGTLYDNNSKWKNILVLTAPGNFGLPWYTDFNQFHDRYFLRLDTDDEDISNPDYLANSGAWNGVRQPGTPGDFKFVNYIGSSGFDGHGAEEGFMTIASDESVLYGMVQGYKENSSGQCIRQSRTKGYSSQNPGATGTYWNFCRGAWSDGINTTNDFTIDRVYYHDTGLVGGLQFPIEELEPDNQGNHVVCKLDAGYTYEYENGLSWRFNLDTGSNYGTNGNGDQQPAETSLGNWYRYWNNKTFADGGCTDWFGETKWGREHGKDVILLHVPRNSRELTLQAPSDDWGPEFATNREGILVIKRDSGSNNLVLLDNDDFSRDNELEYTDTNGYRKVAYAFDSSWGTIYNVPCCEDASGVCIELPSGGGLNQSDCANRPTFVWTNPSGPFVRGSYDWANWSESAVAQANSGDANGNIPTFIGANQPWGPQPFYSPYSGGLSFRPNWIL